MEQKEPYVEPSLEELGSVGDVTGANPFDLGDILGGIFGGGKKPPFGSR